MNMDEIWKDILGYEGMYQVSNKGRIKGLRREFGVINNNVMGALRRFKKERLLRPLINVKNGYAYVQLSKESKIKSFRIHRLVALSFIINSENKPYVNHKDGNKLNNSIENLEWATESENVKHALHNNLMAKGDKSYMSKISKETAIYIKNSKKTVLELCEELNLKYSHVYNLRKGYIWKDIKLENSLKQ